jgi:ribosomal protein L32E
MLDLRPEDPRSVLAAADLRQDWKQYDGAFAILAEMWKRPEAQDRVVRLQLVDRMAKLLVLLNRPEDAARAEAEGQRVRQEWRKERSLSTAR